MANTPINNGVKPAGAAIADVKPPQTEQRNETANMNLTIKTENQVLAEEIRSAQHLPPRETLIQVTEQRIKQVLNFPPECMENQHPELAFCWIPNPDSRHDSDAKKDHYQHYRNQGWSLCGRDTPSASFWSQTGKPGSGFMFDDTGLIRSSWGTLAVTWQDVRKRVQDDEQRVSIARKEELENSLGRGSIKNFGKGDDGADNLPKELGSGSKMFATVNDQDQVALSPNLQTVMSE